MAYIVSLRRSALKELSGLPKTTVKKVSKAIDALAEDPRPEGVKS